MERDLLIEYKNELENFDWNKENELEKRDEPDSFSSALAVNFPQAVFNNVKSNLLNDINYHLYILKKYGNYDSRSQFNINDKDYLVKLWASLTSHLVREYPYLNSINTAGFNEPAKQQTAELKSEVMITYLQHFAAKVDNTSNYRDMILLFYKEQDYFLELKQN